MAINRFVVLALVFVAVVAYVSAADTPATGGDAADASAPAGSPDAGAGAGASARDAGAPDAGDATSGAAPAEGDAPSFKASAVYAIIAAVVVVGCFF